MQRVPLAPHHVAAMRALGAEAHYEPGAFLVQPGERVDRFIYVEDGEVELVNPFTNQRHLPSTLGPTQFLGEIAFLSGARPDRCRCVRAQNTVGQLGLGQALDATARGSSKSASSSASARTAPGRSTMRTTSPRPDRQRRLIMPRSRPSDATALPAGDREGGQG